MKISLKAARTNAGLTQRELAKIGGFGLNSVVSWEKGRKPMSEAEKEKYCEICGCKPENVTCDVLILAKS